MQLSRKEIKIFLKCSSIYIHCLQIVYIYDKVSKYFLPIHLYFFSLHFFMFSLHFMVVYKMIFCTSEINLMKLIFTHYTSFFWIIMNVYDIFSRSVLQIWWRVGGSDHRKYPLWRRFEGIHISYFWYILIFRQMYLNINFPI